MCDATNRRKGISFYIIHKGRSFCTIGMTMQDRK